MKRDIHKKKPESGFTLIELIIVLVIIGIGAALVGMYVGSGSDKMALRTFTKDVSTVLRSARNYAASEKKSYFFVIDREEGRYKLYPQKANDDEETEMVIDKPIPDDLEIVVDFEDDVYEIEFFPRGHSSGGVIEIGARDERGYVLTVNRITGKVVVERAE